MATMSTGPGGDKIKSAVRRFKKEVHMIGVRRKVKRNQKGKGTNEDSGISTSKDTPTSKRQDRVLTNDRKVKQMNREKQRALKKYKREKNVEEAKSAIQEKWQKATSKIKDRVEDFKTNRAAARYKKGKGPRGERATESGSATDEQTCGPDGCKLKGPRGGGAMLRRGKL